MGAAPRGRCEKHQGSSGQGLGERQIPAGCGRQGQLPRHPRPGRGAQPLSHSNASAAEREVIPKCFGRHRLSFRTPTFPASCCSCREEPRSRSPPPRRPPHLPCRSTARRRRPRGPGSMVRTPRRSRAARAAAGRPRPPSCPWPPPGPRPSRGGAAELPARPRPRRKRPPAGRCRSRGAATAIFGHGRRRPRALRPLRERGASKSPSCAEGIASEFQRQSALLYAYTFCRT